MQACVHAAESALRAPVRSCQETSATGTQSKLPLISAMHREPNDAAVLLVRQVVDEGMAVRISMEMGHFKNSYIAACLGVHDSYISKFRSGERVMREAHVDAFCRATGTNLLRQVRKLTEALCERPVSVEKRLAAELRSAA